MDAIEAAELNFFCVNRITPRKEGCLPVELEQLNAVGRSHDEMNPVAPPNGRESCVVVVVVIVVIVVCPARAVLELSRRCDRRHYL